VPVISEEDASEFGTPDSIGPRFFLVDPLDGTKAFVRGDPHFTVNIGLIEDGRPVAGAVAAPPSGEVWYTAAGQALKRMPGVEAHPVRVRPWPAEAAIALLSHTMKVETADKLARAVRLIVTTQNPEGGWRYQPRASEADISVTICQVMALRAARNAGIYVPNETIDRCVDYVKRSQNADGGFMYMLTGGPSRFPRSAAGVVALYSAGIYEGDELRKGLEYLSQHPPAAEEFNRDGHTMYGQYYAVQAMWQAGGEHWKKWYPAVQDVLVRQQQQDGSWQDLICSEYGTAMSCIILQMPNNYLPIFQR
jgi:hypothetical protein